MKGITHYITGITITSFFPAAISAAVNGNPLYFLLGGFCSIIPDTLDFKWLRYHHKHDMEIVPDPLAVDPQQIAEATAEAINRAHHEHRPIRIKYHTIRIKHDSWLPYTIHFDIKSKTVNVTINASPSQPNTLPLSAKASFSPVLKLDYLAKVKVDILDGPLIEFDNSGNNTVHSKFIPWHREKTHSLIMSIITGIVVALIWNIPAGVISSLALVSHILLDQAGYMGSNLLWPLKRTSRTPGLKLQHATDATVNISVVWFCVCTIYWNLHNATNLPAIPPLGYFLGVAALPAYLFAKIFKPRHG